MMRAGFASVDITPEVGSPLSGFIARLDVSKGVDLPLQARALVLESGGTQAALVGLDLLGVAPELADRAVAAVSEALGIPEDHVVVFSSHTHSGPVTVKMRGSPDKVDDSYLETLIGRIVGAATEAQKKLRPATPAWGEAPVTMGVNRRERLPDGSVKLGANPDGPTDTSVRVLRLDGPGRRTVLFEHACHPYCLGGDCNLISPDFFGHAAAALAEQDVDSIYLNGCAGDIAATRGFQGPQAAREEGRRLADAVMAASDGAQPEDDPRLGMLSTRIGIPHGDLTPLSDVKQQIDARDRTVRDEERTDPRVRDRLRAAWRDWMADVEAALGDRKELEPIPARISVMRLGRGAMVFLPGEVFYEIGQRIASLLDVEHVIVGAYSHGYVGYIPTRESYAEGGYEVNEAHRYIGLWQKTPVADSILESEVMRLWWQLEEE